MASSPEIDRNGRIAETIAAAPCALIRPLHQLKPHRLLKHRLTNRFQVGSLAKLSNGKLTDCNWDFFRFEYLD